MLHFEQPKYQGQRTAKIQMIIDQFNEVFGEFYLEENLSINEQIIGYKGKKSSLRQYNPKNRKSGVSRFLYSRGDSVSFTNWSSTVNKLTCSKMVWANLAKWLLDSHKDLLRLRQQKIHEATG